MFRKIAALALAAALSIPLVACATFDDSAVGRALTATAEKLVDVRTVRIASESFNAVEVTATNYLNLPSCAVATTIVCRDPRATKPLIRAIRAGRDARDRAQAFVLAHSDDDPAPRVLYDAVTGGLAGVQSIFRKFNIGATP